MQHRFQNREREGHGAPRRSTRFAPRVVAQQAEPGAEPRHWKDRFPDGIYHASAFPFRLAGRLPSVA